MRLSRIYISSISIAFAAGLLCLANPLFAQVIPDEIPPLKSDAVIALLLYEIEGLVEADIRVLEIKQLEEMARIQVTIRGNNGILDFVCRKTDFGLKWRLAAKIPEELLRVKTTYEPLEKTDDPNEIYESNLEPISARDVDETENKFPTYEEYVREFLASLRQDADRDYDRFFFRDTDFDYANVDDENGNPLEALKARRAAFSKQCSSLAAKLKAAKEFKIVSFLAPRSTRRERAQLKRMLPTATRYRKAVSVELLLDDKRETYVFEGVTLLADGWRLGAIVLTENTR